MTATLGLFLRRAQSWPFAHVHTKSPRYHLHTDTRTDRTPRHVYKRNIALSFPVPTLESTSSQANHSVRSAIMKHDTDKHKENTTSC